MARFSLLLVVLVVVGCTPTPRAPALTDEAVFESADAGMKFVVPQGWIMSSRSVLPPTLDDKPVMLVMYLSERADKPGELRVYAADIPATEPIAAYIDRHPFGPDKRKAAPGGETIMVNGATADRIALVGGKGASEIQEVTAFRRGGRVYLILAGWTKRDTSVRDNLRQSIGTMSFR